MKYVWGLVAAGMCAGNVEAAPKVVHQALEQGGFYVATVPAGSVVTLDGIAVETGPKGELVVGFDRNAKSKAVMKVCKEGNCEETVLNVKARVFKTQNVTGIPQKTVDPDPAEQRIMEEDNAAVKAARDAADKGARWRTAYMEAFSLPIKAPTSGVFGSRRTYNGQERSWHKGHDLAAKTGTPIKAPADGVVRLARSTFMSGNLVMIDHGGALTTVYAHMDTMGVKVGDVVKRGDVIGTVGTTGRSSGPHLHWGAYWKSTPINPILWVSE